MTAPIESISKSAQGRATISAAHPLAVEAGLQAYRDGGNAYDAVVASALVEAVVLPMKCGLGGDVVALVRDPGADWGMLYSVGPGVGALAQGGALTETGPASIGIPGAPAGYAALADRGRLGLPRLTLDAASLAKEGFRWSVSADRYTRAGEALLRQWNDTTRFLPGGKRPEPDAYIQLPGLAALLTEYGNKGRGLYHGEIGRRLADFVRQKGGLLAHEDLTVDPVSWCPVQEFQLPGGSRLRTTAAPTMGPLLGQIVRDALAVGDLTPDIITKARKAARAAGRAAIDGGTSVSIAADHDGNVVVLVHSNSYPRFGSGVVFPEFDLVLNNRPGRGFDLSAPANALAAPRAGVAPPTTLQAWSLDLDGGAVAVGATPGGVNQPVWNAQMLMALIGGDQPGKAVAAPRWALAADATLSVESDHPDARRLGGEPVAPRSMGSNQQIHVVTPGGVIGAYADIRNETAAGAVD